MEDLLEIRPYEKGTSTSDAPQLILSSSPLQTHTWYPSLMEHPDARLRDMVNGILDGFILNIH